MPEPQKKLWLQVWQHAAANNTTLLPSDDWLQAASQLVVALQPSFSKQINKWLVEIVADVFRKDNSFSEHNQHVVCGLLWFASFGDVKILEKVVTKYAKFFFCRSINIALVATDCLEKWQLLD